MTLPSITENFDTMYTTTWYHQKDTAVDNIFDKYPFYAMMRDKGKIRKVRGGRRIEEPLEYGENANIGWIGRGGTVALNKYEFLTVAYYDWKYLYGSVVRFGVDDQQNSGRMQIMNLMVKTLSNTRKGLAKEMETKLFAGAASGDEIDGLQLLVKDDPTTSTSIGRINQSTYSWWANKATNMTGLPFSTWGVPKMRTMLNNVSNNDGEDRPDMILTGQTPFEYYEDNLLDYYQIVNNKVSDLGFFNQQYKGIPMVWSPSCGTRMYFLNTEFLSIVMDPALEFEMTRWKEIPNQINDRAAQIIAATTTTTSRRRAQGVMYNIDTP